MRQNLPIRPLSSRRSPSLLLRGATPLIAVFVAAACGGDSGGSPTAPPTPASPIAGSYSVTVALAQNSCGAVTVQPQPTSVTHVAGESRFSLVHGGNTFAGNLSADLSFAADPLTLRDADGSTLRVLLAGRFADTTLTATVTVDVTGRAVSPANCAYVVQWNGRRNG